MSLSFAVAFVYVAAYLRARRIGEGCKAILHVTTSLLRLRRCEFFRGGAKQAPGDVLTAYHHARLHPYLDPFPLHAHWLFVVRSNEETFAFRQPFVPGNPTLIDVGGSYSSLLLAISFVVNPLIQFWRAVDYRREMRRVLMKLKKNNAVASVVELNEYKSPL